MENNFKVGDTVRLNSFFTILRIDGDFCYIGDNSPVCHKFLDSVTLESSGGTISNISSEGEKPLLGDQGSVLLTMLEVMRKERDDLRAQLIEVVNGSTGKAPCERHCEAFAANRMMKSLRGYNARLKEDTERLTSAYHQLKKAVAAVEICGVPLHHLSHDLSKHFDINTVDFSQDMKIKNLDEFRKQLRKHANENQPDDCSEDMVNGWKSAMCEVFSFIDGLIAEVENIQNQSGDYQWD